MSQFSSHLRDMVDLEDSGEYLSALFESQNLAPIEYKELLKRLHSTLTDKKAKGRFARARIREMIDSNLLRLIYIVEHPDKQLQNYLQVGEAIDFIPVLHAYYLDGAPKAPIDREKKVHFEILKKNSEWDLNEEELELSEEAFKSGLDEESYHDLKSGLSGVTCKEGKISLLLTDPEVVPYIDHYLASKMLAA